MIAKCGPRVLHHWAHHRQANCDPWWENETPWHREWKNRFPIECQEVSHAALDGEIHRADIKTPTGIIIEVQHSLITEAERLSREMFYLNMVWIVDGSGFRKNFDIYHALPSPESEMAKDLVWVKAKRHMRGANNGLYFRHSEAQVEQPGITKAEVNSGWIHGMHEVQEGIGRAYNGYHQYDWVRPRRTWLEATCPVYIDFGDDYLVKMQVYDDSGLECVRLVAKRKFVHDAMTESHSDAIATRFYPIPQGAS